MHSHVGKSCKLRMEPEGRSTWKTPTDLQLLRLEFRQSRMPFYSVCAHVCARVLCKYAVLCLFGKARHVAPGLQIWCVTKQVIVANHSIATNGDYASIKKDESWLQRRVCV